jgi:hypothetical protein
MHDIGGSFMMDFIFWGVAGAIALTIFFTVIAPIIFGSVKAISINLGPPLVAALLLLVGWRVEGIIGWLIMGAGVLMGVYSYIYYKEKLYED